MSPRNRQESEIEMLYVKRNVTHSCGKQLVHVKLMDKMDVTAYGDAPESMRDRNGIPTVSWHDLPMKYHKFIDIVCLSYWQNNEQTVEECPGCHQLLEESQFREKEQ